MDYKIFTHRAFLRGVIAASSMTMSSPVYSSTARWINQRCSLIAGVRFARVKLMV
jgi:hypothetical protein